MDIRIAFLLPVLVSLALVSTACSGGDPEPTGGPTGRQKTVAGLSFVEISAGSFTMGAAEPGPMELVRWPELSKPRHLVTIAAPLWVATTEVPNALYSRFKTGHIKSKKNPDLADPAVWMSHDDAKKFCDWMTEKHEGTFRLPSEAEWEYLCRAGSTEVYSFGDDEAELPTYAWFAANSDGRTRPVGTSRENAWGLSDFHGNVLEYTADSWHGNYRGAPADGSVWSDERTTRVVIRGGSFEDPPGSLRSGLRTAEKGGSREPDHFVGIRLVATFDD